MPGRSTRPTTSRTASPTRSRASRTRSARSSSPTTGRSTTGSSSTCRCHRGRASYEFARLNLTLYRALEAHPAPRSSRTAASAAGTTPGCRPSRGSDGAATRPRRSATSRRRSACRAAIRSSTSACSSTPCAGPQPDRPASLRRPATAPARHRGLPRRPGRDPRRPRQPRRSVRGHPPGAVLARAVHRARRLHGGSAQAVLPARARARSAPPLRIFRHLP